jgi:hypothetical protein
MEGLVGEVLEGKRLLEMNWDYDLVTLSLEMNWN